MPPSGAAAGQAGVAADQPGVAATQVRLAVRAALADLPSGALVAVAVSGGRDSLSLLAATVAVAPALGLRVAVATVDHGWHDGSRAVADAVVEAGRRAGADPTEVVAGARAGDTPSVARGGGGPEARAREARYAALDEVARRWSAQAVLLGHTLDDQAESVLIGLARGSGPRSLAGMADRRDPYRRPLLGLRRAVVHEALADLVTAAVPDGLPAGLPWEDPANADPAMLRPRVRHTLLPVLEEVLGPGSVDALARTARLLREDADALDGIATAAAAAPDALDTATLASLPVAVRARVLRCAAAAAGAGGLTAAHTTALLDLAESASGSGAGPVALPGGVSASRGHGRLSFGPAAPAPGDDEER